MLAETVHMLYAGWFDDWNDWGETGENRPGPIDNYSLLSGSIDSDYTIRSGIEEEEHFIFVPNVVWDRL
jgi:hypothetical protein